MEIVAVKGVGVVLYTIVSTTIFSLVLGFFFLSYTNVSLMILCDLLIIPSCICNCCYIMNIALSFCFSGFEPFLKHLSLSATWS